MKQKTRFNIYYSSPYFYLYDGDDKTGVEVFKTRIESEVIQKQIDFEEANKTKEKCDV
jgi:hypothetical protein